jgi:hypothetical protein
MINDGNEADQGFQQIPLRRIMLRHCSQEKKNGSLRRESRPFCRETETEAKRNKGC